MTVIGTQCIGKSTFIKDFLEVNSKFILPEVNYRKVIEQNKLKLNREGDYRSQRYLSDFMRDQALELSKEKDKFYIVDRSIIDVVAYSMWLYDNRPDVFSEDQICQMITELIDYVKIYDLVVYIPLSLCNNVKVEDDKFRDTNIEYRENIDNNFKNIFDMLDMGEFKMPKIISIYGNRTERIEMLKKNAPGIF